LESGVLNQINQGEVISVRGSVIDARFTNALPEIDHLLIAGDDGKVMIEVMVHINSEIVRGIALTSAQGLARGSVVLDTGKPIMVPVGERLLGRVFNVFGRPIDSLGDIEALELRSIHQDPVSLTEQV
jgi:F-type H+/Na+-transporting ATPase subunit beta